jgi:hypothetical protein
MISARPARSRTLGSGRSASAGLGEISGRMVQPPWCQYTNVSSNGDPGWRDLQVGITQVDVLRSLVPHDRSAVRSEGASNTWTMSYSSSTRTLSPPTSFIRAP